MHDSTDDPSTDSIRGASPGLVRDALDDGDPLPGDDALPRGRGFAGVVDGAVVRDVLGRELVYTERDDPGTWAFDPDELTDPDLVPAGYARSGDGDRRVWSLPDYSPRDDDVAAVAAVRDALARSLDSVSRDGLAVAFSGGVDSAALAARLDAPLYVAGFEGSHDLEAARSAAALLDGDLRVVELTHRDLERAVPDAARAIGRTNAMDVAIALPLYLVAERASADGYDRLAVGQGADELFAGYAKVAGAPDDERVDADTVRGARREVVETLPSQLERDVRALRGVGVEPVAPMIDDGVVDAALRLPGHLLVSDDGERKVALRRAVAPWVPDEVVDREKKALQYGSLVSRELDRLARQAGFKRQMDDHVTRYVESLVDARTD